MNDSAFNKVIRFADETFEPDHPCVKCQRKKPFEAPLELVKAFMDGSIVLFAGAGISTESKEAMSHSLYDEISHKIGNKDRALPFPDLAEALCREPSGRVNLIRLIKERLNYIYAHSSLYEAATRFHAQLATLFPVDTIVTTNWDSYFEDECGATAFVEDKDLASLERG